MRSCLKSSHADLHVAVVVADVVGAVAVAEVVVAIDVVVCIYCCCCYCCCCYYVCAYRILVVWVRSSSYAQKHRHLVTQLSLVIA